jgi:thioredoxin-dependent peroxiredoxin
MIDLPKATKGRRMSKKTRKKSTKLSSAKAPRAASKTAAKKPPAKTRAPSAAKTDSRPTSKIKKPSSGTLHKAPSKPLKPPAPAKPAARVTESKATPATAKPAATKPAVTKAAGPLAEGSKAPAFRLPRDGGDTVALSDFAGKKLVLFFYPRADTPGCTREAIDFSRLAGAFAEAGTAVLGVSADPPKAQEAFRNKHELTTPLISDETHEMLEAYGAWGEKSMYGRTFQGILRTTVLVGEDGRVIRIWRHVKVDGHADGVLAAVQAL